MAPGIGALEPLGRSLKCEALGGELGGRPVVAKVLTGDVPLWRWYFEREIRVLERLPAGLDAPRLVVADAAAGVMVVSRIAGTPLARRRRVSATVEPQVIDRALAIADAAAAVDLGGVDAGPPPPALVREMRARLLEDPTAPRAWFVDGVERCRSLGLIADGDASVLGERFETAPIAVGHGDLLPRNIVAVGGRVGLIDWECAGEHLRDWDRALLWANLAAPGRARVEASLGAGPERIEVFRALCAFALGREVKFCRPGSPSRSRLEADLAAALANCRG